jgi:hypothetical protein
VNAFGLALRLMLKSGCSVSSSQHDVHDKGGRVALDCAPQDADGVRSSVGQDISDAQIESDAIGKLGLELCEKLPARDRPRDVAFIEQNRNEVVIAFGVAAVEVYRAFQSSRARS